MAKQSSFDHKSFGDKQVEIDNGVQINIEKLSRSLLERSGWALVDLPSIATSELRSAAESSGLRGDTQTDLFVSFISLATNFSSANFTERLKRVPVLVTEIKDLSHEVWKEIRDYRDLVESFQELVNCFNAQVRSAQYRSSLALSYLEPTLAHLEVLGDVFRTTSNTDLDNEAKKDLGIVLEGLSTGIGKLTKLSRSSSAEAQALNERIINLRDDVRSRKVVVEGRLDFVSSLSWTSALRAAGVGVFAAEAIVGAEVFGGGGALIVGGMAVPPVGAMILAAVVGGIVMGTLVALVTRLWTNHQYKALGFLTEIFNRLTELSDANVCFLEDLRRSEVSASKLDADVNSIKTSLESARYRRYNVGICARAVESTKSVISCLERVSQIDISKWNISIRSSDGAAMAICDN